MKTASEIEQESKPWCYELPADPVNWDDPASWRKGATRTLEFASLADALYFVDNMEWLMVPMGAPLPRTPEQRGAHWTPTEAWKFWVKYLHLMRRWGRLTQDPVTPVLVEGPDLIGPRELWQTACLTARILSRDEAGW